MTSKVSMECKSCGSQDVYRDAWVEWNIETQEWEIQNIFDYAYCANCESETSIIERDVNV